MDLDLLRSVSILRELDEQELADFANLINLREIKAGERIIEEGTPVTAFYVVCDGVMHVRRLAQKREMLLGRLGAGAFFGEINLFDPGLATASIYSMKRGQLAVIAYSDLRAYMAKNCAAGYKIVSAMMGEMARRLRTTSARLVNSVYWSSGDSLSSARKI